MDWFRAPDELLATIPEKQRSGCFLCRTKPAPWMSFSSKVRLEKESDPEQFIDVRYLFTLCDGCKKLPDRMSTIERKFRALSPSQMNRLLRAGTWLKVYSSKDRAEEQTRKDEAA
jgi:hypothetical protein